MVDEVETVEVLTKVRLSLPNPAQNWQGYKPTSNDLGSDDYGCAFKPWRNQPKEVWLFDILEPQMMQAKLSA